MDGNIQQEIFLLKRDLQHLIDELYEISGGLQRDFQGIGNDTCAAALRETAQYYEKLKVRLDKMDLSALSDEFIREQKRAEARAQAAREREQARLRELARQEEARRAEEERKRLERQAQAEARKPVPKPAAKPSRKPQPKKPKNLVDQIGDFLDWLF